MLIEPVIERHNDELADMEEEVDKITQTDKGGDNIVFES